MRDLSRRNLLQTTGVGALLATLPLSAHAAGDAVSIGWPSDVPSWDPNQRFVPDAQSIFKMVYDQPLDQAPDLKLIPHLLTKWEMGPDAKTFTAEMRDDATWHNGDRVTSADFRYTFFERIKSGVKLDTVNIWRKVTDIETPTPTRIVMHLDQPSPTVPAWLCFLGSYVVPKAYIESVGADAFAAKPIGSGPYKLAEYELNSRIVLERNDAYWGPKPKLRRVTIQIIKDPSARVAAIQSGEVDLTVSVPVREVTRLKAQAGLSGEFNPISRVILLQCRNDLAFSDPERASRGAPRHRQGGAVEGVLRRGRGAAVGSRHTRRSRLRCGLQVRLRSRTVENAAGEIRIRARQADQAAHGRDQRAVPQRLRHRARHRPRCGRRSASTATST